MLEQKILVSEKRFACFLVSLTLLLSRCAVKLGQNTLKMRSSKRTFCPSGCLTVQKGFISQGNTFSLWNCQVKSLKLFRKGKKKRHLSLRRAGMPLTAAELLWFFHRCTAEIKTGPLCPNTDTVSWKTPCRLLLLPGPRVADNPPASQVPWDCIVLPVVGKAPFATCCISCLLDIEKRWRQSAEDAAPAEGIRLGGAASAQPQTLATRTELTGVNNNFYFSHLQ